MSNQTEADFIEHTACESCGSSDGKAVYSDGHTYCFVCNTYGKADGQKEEGQPISTTVKKDVSSNWIKGEYQDLAKRKISSSTCKALGYKVGEYQGQPCHIADVHDQAGNLVAQKIRLPNKDFRVIGDLSKGGLIFQNRWKSAGKRLVICEGELDALSYAEVSPKWEVVSVPNGAQGAVKAIKRSLEFVESFEEVVFLFDRDDAGYEAARQCAEIIQVGKAKIARTTLKDANDMLVAGKVKELKEAVWSARPYSPEGIVMGHELTVQALQEQTPKGHCIPYVKLNSMIRGLRKRELVMITAGSGIGKSTMARELGYHLHTSHEQKVGYVMLEESVTKTAQALIAIDNDVPLGDLMEDPTILDDKQWSASYNKCIKDTAFYDSFGSTEVDNLIGKIRYLAVGLECDFIVLDHVSMVVSGLDTDERKTLDILMTKLRQLVENTGVGVICISHVRRGNKSKSFNEGEAISLTDLRGSASIEQLSDIVIACERDQQANEGSNVTQIRLLKNRPFGDVGAAGHAEYIAETGRLLPTDFEPSNTTQQESSPFVEDDITDI